MIIWGWSPPLPPAHLTGSPVYFFPLRQSEHQNMLIKIELALYNVNKTLV